jgi:hypothetical protein
VSGVYTTDMTESPEESHFPFVAAVKPHSPFCDSFEIVVHNLRLKALHYEARLISEDLFNCIVTGALSGCNEAHQRVTFLIVSNCCFQLDKRN